MRTSILLIILTLISISQLFTATSYGEEQKQIQINTKMNIPEKIPSGDTIDFTIDVTYKGPYSWVKNLEPRFEIIPSRASSNINIQYDDSISDFTIWKGHIHTLHGSLQVSEETPFEAIYLSVSFEGVVRFDEQVVSVDPDSTVSLMIESQSEVSDSQTPLEEHYNIEIFSLKEEYEVGEEYSFYFVISGYGYSCANYEAKYPDENGNIVGVGAEVLCAPETSMHDFEINSLDQRGTLGNVGIKNPGTYTVTVTFDKPDKYYPTIVSKDFRVVEPMIKLSPLKQFKVGIPIDEIECNEQLILIQKYDGSPACVKPRTIEELIDRNWTTSLIVRETALKSMSKNLGPECSQHTIHEIQNGDIDQECRDYLTKLSEEHKSEMISQGYSFDNEQNVWVKEGYPGVMMSIVDFYLQNQNSSKYDTNESKKSEKSWTASYYPGFLPFTSIDSFGRIHSIDIDQNYNVVVGTQTGNHDGVLHYLDNNGNEIWQKKTDKIIGFVDISDDGNVITARGYELTDGGARTFHNHQLIVFDKSGTELWRYPADFDFDEENMAYSSFTLSSTNKGGFHLIGKGNNTSLLDGNGNKVWESIISGNSRTSKISQTENFILIGTENDQDKIDYDWGLTLLGMDGQILWEKSGTDGQIISSNAIAISSNDNFISMGIAPRGDEGVLYVFDVSGELIWKETTASVISFTDFTEDEGHLVVITNEEMRFYDVDGNLLWTKDIVFRPAMSSYYVAGRSPYEYQDLLRVFDYGGNQVFEYPVNSTISSIKISDDSKLLVMGTQGKTEVGPGTIFYFNQIE